MFESSTFEFLRTPKLNKYNYTYNCYNTELPYNKTLPLKKVWHPSASRDTLKVIGGGFNDKRQVIRIADTKKSFYNYLQIRCKLQRKEMLYKLHILQLIFCKTDGVTQYPRVPRETKWMAEAKTWLWGSSWPTWWYNYEITLALSLHCRTDF